jgi:hypothetical protein
VENFSRFRVSLKLAKMNGLLLVTRSYRYCVNPKYRISGGVRMKTTTASLASIFRLIELPKTGNP